jgi:predicted alpha/beta superfamily hydrolase
MMSAFLTARPAAALALAVGGALLVASAAVSAADAPVATPAATPAATPPVTPPVTPPALSAADRFAVFTSASAAAAIARTTASGRVGIYAAAPTRDRIVKSRAMGDYRIRVAVPLAPPPAEGYPVVYVLDGDDYFEPGVALASHLIRTSNGSMTPGIIVGVGYPGNSRRSYDYLPASAVSPDIERRPDGRPMIDDAYGGADGFVDFLDKELKPLMQASYRIDPQRQALYGHSYGGLLAVHAMFTRPEMFQTYLLSSPSLGWNGRYVLSEEPGFNAKVKAGTHRIAAVVTVGEYEQALSPEQLRAPDAAERAARASRRRSVDSDRDLSARLDALAPDRLRSRFRMFPGEVHGSVALPAFAYGLPTAFAAQH